MAPARGRGRGRGNSMWAAYRTVRDGYPTATRGRISKTGAARGASAGKPRTAGRKPYKPAEYPQSESVYYDKTESWDATRLVPGTKKIVFGEDFDVTPQHLDEIIATGPALCHTLLHFGAGNDDTGRRARLHDEAVIRFAAAAPNLVHVKLSGATGLSDASLAALLEDCRQLQYICIEGNDKVDGHIKGPALDTLRERPELGKKLDTIRLVNQDSLETEFITALKKLSAARKKLAIQFGSMGSGLNVDTWLGGKRKSGYQALGGPGGFSQYGGY